MPRHHVVVRSPIRESFRVAQLQGLFDVPVKKQTVHEWDVELPDDGEDWTIGCIVGPSGSGKSTLARHAFGGSLYHGARWPKDLCVIEAIAGHIRDVTGMLTSVGFSSPPSWLKPYQVLSGGEQFRCDLARALLSGERLIVFDEFTSVVDRTVAKIGSAAVAKAVRKRAGARFVAVTCHYDVVEWLEPDWVLDMATGELARRRLWRRPVIVLAIFPVHRTAWVLFAHHHYLSGSINNGARCFLATWEGAPVAFSSWIHTMTKFRRSLDMREHRTVVLPDYQGIGIGNRVSAFCASIWRGVGGRAFSTTSHPAMIRHRSGSPVWRRRRLGMVGVQGTSGKFDFKRYRKSASCARVTAGFEYVGPKMARADAQRYVMAARGVRPPKALPVGAETGLACRGRGRGAPARRARPAASNAGPGRKTDRAGSRRPDRARRPAPPRPKARR